MQLIYFCYMEIATYIGHVEMVEFTVHLCTNATKCPKLLQ